MHKKYLLTFGVPGKDFKGFLVAHYPSAQGWRLWCAESRPYEVVLGERLVELVACGYDTSVITDNMMGFCLAKKVVNRVVLFYQQKDEHYLHCQGGGMLVAVLAHELGVPCHPYPTEYPLEPSVCTPPLRFAGTLIVPEGVKSFTPLMDKIPVGYCSHAEF